MNLIRNPKRGKAHRPDDHGSTLCGKFARDMTEEVSEEIIAPEDICTACDRIAWMDGDGE